jgi:protein-S-isoprenylcysteine O-methyltransferase Ste14
MLRLILLQNLGMHFDLTVLLLISEHTVPPDWVFALAPFLCISGVFLHYVSDAQKFFVLQLRKGVVQDGLFARTRNPNYLGEVLINGGFAVASWHWPLALVLAGWFPYFARNMRRKDRSMSRYREFAAYKDRTGIFVPSLGIGSTRLRPVQQVSATRI